MKSWLGESILLVRSRTLHFSGLETEPGIVSRFSLSKKFTFCVKCVAYEAITNSSLDFYLPEKVAFRRVVRSVGSEQELKCF